MQGRFQFGGSEAGAASDRLEAGAVAATQQYREVPVGSLGRVALPARDAGHAEERVGQFRKVAERFRRYAHSVHLQRCPEPQVCIVPHLYLCVVAVRFSF